MGTLANSEDLDEMHYTAAFHQGLHCLLRLKQSSGMDIYIIISLSTHWAVPILIVSICMGKSIRIQKVNLQYEQS